VFSERSTYKNISEFSRDKSQVAVTSRFAILGKQSEYILQKSFLRDITRNKIRKISEKERSTDTFN